MIGMLPSRALGDGAQREGDKKYLDHGVRINTGISCWETKRRWGTSGLTVNVPVYEVTVYKRKIARLPSFPG